MCQSSHLWVSCSHDKGLNNPARDIDLRCYQRGIDSGNGTYCERELHSDAWSFVLGSSRRSSSNYGKLLSGIRG